MSRTFSVPNKKSFFGFGKMHIMSVKEILQLVEDLTVFDFTAFSPEEALEQSARPLTDFECLQVGVEGVSSRSFEVSYEQDHYNVRVLTPSTSADWQIAIHFTQTLAKHLGSTITDEEGINYKNQQITYDYKNDIRAGIAALDRPDMDFVTLFGFHHPWCVGEEEVKRINEAEDPIEMFDKMFYENQNVDAFFASQQFYHNEEEKIFAVYVFSQGVRLILPYKPTVEFHNREIVDNDNVAYWKAVLLGTEGDTHDLDNYGVIAELDYEQLIERLPKDKYQRFDSKYILVEPFTYEEMKRLTLLH